MLLPPESAEPARKINVLLFSGGRGSSVLSRQLIRHPQVNLTLAINGYDDGASTGEVRKFLGDCLGPSDFRKNASRIARELDTCRPELIDLFDIRLPVDCSTGEGLTTLHSLIGRGASESRPAWVSDLEARADLIGDVARSSLATRLECFIRELETSGKPFSFSDCAVGNIVFAGCFLAVDRRFNEAISDYCALLNLPEGMIENVTDGTNAFLVALDEEGRILASEADIVDAKRRNHISEIHLLDRPLTELELRSVESGPSERTHRLIEDRCISPPVNPRLLDKISEADLIIYSPGTQHSSLFPSYLTPGIGPAIAKNLKANKLFITNLREDAEIPDSSAVDIIEKALYYLKDRNRASIPSPCLITHYLLNDSHKVNDEKPYVPLGRLETLEDPRLIRIANFEEGSTGFHDAAQILLPQIDTVLKRSTRLQIAIWLLNTESIDKITQTILEALRSGLDNLAATVSVFYASPASLSPEFTDSLPFICRNVTTSGIGETGGFVRTIKGQRFDYVILVESSGMYSGEDIVNVAALLTNPRIDSVWGSRRLSLRDIQESYKFRYRNNPVLGAISYAGSHLLSLIYLLRFGRYVTDTLSGIRAIRSSYLISDIIDIDDPGFNHHLLTRLLKNRAEMIETPVRFFPLSPKKVRRTSMIEGIKGLWIALFGRSEAITPEPESYGKDASASGSGTRDFKVAATAEAPHLEKLPGPRR